MKVKNACITLALIVVTAFAFAGSVRNGFVNFDDDKYVVNNEHVRQGLSLSNIRWAAVATYFSNWHPLTWLSYELDTTLFGLDPWGYHATNVALHCLNSGLLFHVLRRMTGFVGRSAVVAAVFALHPLHVESVAWISERKDVLSGLCFVLTLWAYDGYGRAPSGRRYLPVVLLFALGLMAKPMLVSLPCVLLLVDFWPLGRWPARPWSRLVVEKLPLLLLSTASCAVTFLVQQQSGGIKGTEQLPISARLVNVPIAYIEYLSKTFWPTGLAVYYPHPYQTGSVYKAAAAVTFLLATSLLAARFARRAPYFAVGWFWWLGMLVPVIGLVQTGGQAYADRYMYLPLIGLAIAVVWGGHELAASRGWPAWVGQAAAVISIVACVPCTQRQVRYWHDSVALWRHAVDVTAANPVAFNSLGLALAEQDKLEEADKWLRQGVAIDPDDEHCHFNLGLVLLRQKRNEEAIAEFREALRTNAANAKTQYHLGRLLLKKGETAIAIGHLRAAVEIDPANWPSHLLLAQTLAAQGQIPEAEAHAAAALRINPDLAKARLTQP